MRLLPCFLVTVMAGCGGGGGGGDVDAAHESDAAGSVVDAAAPDATPAPDLAVIGSTTDDSLLIDAQTFNDGSCALVENCIGALGTRQLLRFNVAVVNQGNLGIDLGAPGDDPWVYSACHDHFHLPGLLNYELVDGDGDTVAQTQYEAFCVQDFDFIDGSSEATHDCADQGLSVGWASVWTTDLPCQWIDITDVSPGSYELRITVNDSGVLPDSDLTNDVYETQVEIPR